MLNNKIEKPGSIVGKIRKEQGLADNQIEKQGLADNQIEKLGSIVRKVRKEQGLTQEQLAATTGAGVRFIRELEHGKESCHIGKALTVVSMLGIDVTIGGEVL